LFVDTLVWQLRTFYTLEGCAASSMQALRTEVDRPILLRRLEGHCALERLSHIIGQLGVPFSSVGSISPRLTASAQAVPNDGLTGARIVFLLCDEIVTRGQPMLITLAPRSLALLKIELVDNREATTWQKHGEALAEAGWIAHHTVVADQGAGLVQGCALMGLTYHPDVFPLLRPLARFGERFARQALAASAWEYERGALASGRSEGVIHQRLASYEAAKAAAAAKIQRYDHCC
jgi:hypothetical protein